MISFAMSYQRPCGCCQLHYLDCDPQLYHNHAAEIQGCLRRVCGNCYWEQDKAALGGVYRQNAASLWHAPRLAVCG